MDLSIYFEPINIEDFRFFKDEINIKLGHSIHINSNIKGFPSLDNASLAILGVGEERNAVNNSGTSLSPNQIRKYLYDLYPHGDNINIMLQQLLLLICLCR